MNAVGPSTRNQLEDLLREGIDGALHLVDRLVGRSKARQTARSLEYIWQPLTEKSNR